MDIISEFYRNKIHDKYSALGQSGFYNYQNLSIEYNFPQLYDNLSFVYMESLDLVECNCEICQEKNEIKNIQNIQNFNNFNKLLKFNKCKIRKYVNAMKNKMYFCEKRIMSILHMIYDYVEQYNKDIVIIVPRGGVNIGKIKKILIKYSKGKIISTIHSKLKLDENFIHLISPNQFIEGCKINSETIGLVLLNGFYYHEFIQNILYEEMLNICWIFRNCSRLVMIKDNNDIYNNENLIIKKICGDLKIVSQRQDI